jgi:hypothetical protein
MPATAIITFRVEGRRFATRDAQHTVDADRSRREGSRSRRMSASVAQTRVEVEVEVSEPHR